jgi:hypothetical protein
VISEIIELLMDGWIGIVFALTDGVSSVPAAHSNNSIPFHNLNTARSE